MPIHNRAPERGEIMRVVVADDALLLRAGVARLLQEAGFEVVAECSTVDDLLLKVRSFAPDVAIIDIRMPPTYSDEGLQAAEQIRTRHPGVGIVLLSQYVELGLAMKLLSDDAEGIGYLLKDRITDLEEFAAAIRRVGHGGSAIDPKIVSQLLGRRRPDNPLERLTPREQEVLELLAQGRSNQAIADRLVITLRAAEKHVSSIFDKLALPATTDDHRRVLAVLAFLRA
jgi:DNA-binding NarL/FixJ family response regulator